MNPLDKFLSDGAKLEHQVKVSFDEDAVVKIALVLVGVVVLNALLRKLLS